MDHTRRTVSDADWVTSSHNQTTYRLLLDGPDFYDHPRLRFYDGSNLRIVQALSSYLFEHDEQISTIDCALFLFSTPLLARTLKQLSEQGIRIRVVSTPLDSYHKAKISLADKDGEMLSKHDIATRIYTYFAKPSNLELRIFPHVFVRSPSYRQFERGSAPYSLHTKSIWVNFKNGKTVEILTSCNMSGADEIKDELLLIIERDAMPIKQQAMFFETLWDASVNDKSDFDIFHYKIQVQRTPAIDNESFFSAPFFSGSNREAEAICQKIIEGAELSIDISAEHIAAGSYSVNSNFADPPKSGWLTYPCLSNSLCTARDNDVLIRFLSQTGADPDREWRGMRVPENRRQFEEFISFVRNEKLGSYTAQNSNHMKFIVADSKVLISTSNFTPTSFAYLPNVSISKFQWDANRSYNGIHSEIGHWVTFEDENISNALRERMLSVTSRTDAFKLA